ncbi:MAG: hypothetical protein JJE52_13825 [Acidimicrobiia bacterium]|nr:hypothetical protein [Acidimicrobiia bacterium]
MRMQRQLTALLLAGVLALGACGGDDDTADDADSTSSTATTDAADEVATTGASGFLELGDLRGWGSLDPVAGDEEVAGDGDGGGEGEGSGPVMTTPEGVETFEPNVEPTESEIPMYEG